MGKYKKGTYLIEIYQKDRKLLQNVSLIIEKVVGRRPTIVSHKKCWRLRICNKELYKKLLLVKKMLFKEKRTTIAYLKGYYDAEGSISNRRIILYQKNREELEKIKNFLENLGIKTGKISWYNTVWGLPIYDKRSREIFWKIIGFRHPRKSGSPP